MRKIKIALIVFIICTVFIGVPSVISVITTSFESTVQFIPTNQTIGNQMGLNTESLGQADVNSLQNLGCHLVRRDLSWQDLEIAPNVWNFNGSYYYNGKWINETSTRQPLRSLDAEFSRCAQAHIKILLILSYTPLWAINPKYSAENASAGGDIFLPPDLDDWRSMLDTVMTRYANNSALFGFEVWNEPSGAFMHGWDKDNDYLQMLSIAVQEAVKINTEFNSHLIKVYATDWAHFYKEVTDPLVLANLDGAAWHYYGFLPEGARAEIKLLEANKPRSDFQLLITETGYPTGSGYTKDSFRVSSIEQAAMLTETFSIMSESVNDFFWFYHRGDNPFAIDNPTLSKPLPAYWAYQQVTQALENKNTTFGSIVSGGSSTLSLQSDLMETHVFIGNDSASVVFWTRGSPVDINVQFGEYLGGFQPETPSSVELVDITNNSTFSLQPSATGSITVKCGTIPQILKIDMANIAMVQLRVNYSTFNGWISFLGFGVVGLIVLSGIFGYIWRSKTKKMKLKRNLK